MYLIVGLGNPGKEYAGSRHNLGFQVVEALSRRLQVIGTSQKHWSVIAESKYKGEKVMLAQPLTYMNLSGRAVRELVRNYSIELSDLLVIYDDLDIPPGTIRFRARGGSAGHRGLQSIIDSLGTNEFPRLRVGIGKAPDNMEASDFVILSVEKTDKILFAEAIDRSVEAILHFIDCGLESTMNVFHKGATTAD
ncbi:MAG: aminoacyl-tRNA hydrolase [Bacillota bacterium]|nr:aminoacyl-tRNA hydrolase [Bacillota bacterium]MDW7729382.1 aminoacyl-tRNA hydrolase [Bacillota bacterium]